MSPRPSLLKLLILVSAVTACLPLLAAGGGDRVQFGRSIVVAEDETAGDLVCVGCSVRVEGTCHDVVAVGGSVSVSGTVKGDMVAVGGGISLGENATVGGDVVTVGGHLMRHPNSIVKGEIRTRSGAPIFLALILIPLIPIILVVGLIVWLVKPNRPRTAMPTWQPPPPR